MCRVLIIVAAFALIGLIAYGIIVGLSILSPKVTSSATTPEQVQEVNLNFTPLALDLQGRQAELAAHCAMPWNRSHTRIVKTKIKSIVACWILLFRRLLMNVTKMRVEADYKYSITGIILLVHLLPLSLVKIYLFDCRLHFLNLCSNSMNNFWASFNFMQCLACWLPVIQLNQRLSIFLSNIHIVMSTVKLNHIIIFPKSIFSTLGGGGLRIGLSRCHYLDDIGWRCIMDVFTMF